MKNAKKLRLFVVAHGRIPGSRMAHKVYHWVDPEGRPTTPPPDPFEVQDTSRNGEFKLLNEADERKVGYSLLKLYHKKMLSLQQTGLSMHYTVLYAIFRLRVKLFYPVAHFV